MKEALNNYNLYNVATFLIGGEKTSLTENNREIKQTLNIIKSMTMVSFSSSTNLRSINCKIACVNIKSL